MPYQTSNAADFFQLWVMSVFATFLLADDRHGSADRLPNHRLFRGKVNFVDVHSQTNDQQPEEDPRVWLHFVFQPAIDGAAIQVEAQPAPRHA